MIQSSFDLKELPSPKPDKTGWPWTDVPDPLPECMPDGSPWPKISVVTPSYNQGQFIEETIRSVLLQGYPNLEFIIIDGSSMDNSLEIIKKYEPWLACWESEPDRGQGHAINKGIKKANGEIIFWLNSDDILMPGALRIVAETFTEHPQVSIMSGQALIIDEEGRRIGKLNSYFASWDELATNPGNSIRQISTFFRCHLFDEFGMVDENLYIALDTDLLLRFTMHHVPLIIDTELAAFRVQTGAKTSNQLLIGYQETDQHRLKLLSGQLLRKYRQRSSSNWLYLAQYEKRNKKEKLFCLKNALFVNKIVIIKRKFWRLVFSQLAN